MAVSGKLALEEVWTCLLDEDDTNSYCCHHHTISRRRYVGSIYGSKIKSCKSAVAFMSPKQTFSKVRELLKNNYVRGSRIRTHSYRHRHIRMRTRTRRYYAPNVSSNNSTRRKRKMYT
jgi:hypothetical protein